MSESHTKPSRRGFMLGATVAGAAAAAAVTLPRNEGDTPFASQDKAPPPPEKGGGYRVSEHVMRYYKTTQL
jgi:hypothetical protein